MAPSLISFLIVEDFILLLSWGHQIQPLCHSVIWLEGEQKRKENGKKAMCSCPPPCVEPRSLFWVSGSLCICRVDLDEFMCGISWWARVCLPVLLPVGWSFISELSLSQLLPCASLQQLLPLCCPSAVAILVGDRLAWDCILTENPSITMAFPRCNNMFKPLWSFI